MKCPVCRKPFAIQRVYTRTGIVINCRQTCRCNLDLWKWNELKPRNLLEILEVPTLGALFQKIESERRVVFNIRRRNQKFRIIMEYVE